MTAHKGWYSRHYLPHFDSPGVVQAVTFRLADSLPVYVAEAVEQEPKTRAASAVRARIQQDLDRGHGSCALRDPRIARVVQESLLYFDGERYRLLAWVVMPNHVHVLVETIEGYALASVVQSWKRHTARHANLLLYRQGRFWQPDFYDRYVRNARHYDQAVAYVHSNPVSAGLVQVAEDWPWSSASLEWQGRESPLESGLTLL